MLLSSCSSVQAPKESVAGIAYEQCMALIKIMEKAGAERTMINEQRNKCRCVANATWEIEQTGEWMELAEKAQREAERRCMTKTERSGAGRRKRALKEFVSTIDSLFR